MKRIVLFLGLLFMFGQISAQKASKRYTVISGDSITLEQLMVDQNSIEEKTVNGNAEKPKVFDQIAETFNTVKQSLAEKKNGLQKSLALAAEKRELEKQKALALKAEKEIGTGTGFERRCGWIDLVALKYAIMLNGVTKLVLTKCDALDDFETVKACVAYKKDTEFIDYYPDEKVHDELEPVYVEMQGWKDKLSDARTQADLPPAFMEFVEFLEKELGTPIAYISVGQDKEHLIERVVRG